MRYFFFPEMSREWNINTPRYRQPKQRAKIKKPNIIRGKQEEEFDSFVVLMHSFHRLMMENLFRISPQSTAARTAAQWRWWCWWRRRRIEGNKKKTKQTKIEILFGILFNKLNNSFQECCLSYSILHLLRYFYTFYFNWIPPAMDRFSRDSCITFY